MKIYIYVMASPLSQLISASDGRWGHYVFRIPDGYYDRESSSGSGG